jgi:hypothetical protein
MAWDFRDPLAETHPFCPSAENFSGWLRHVRRHAQVFVRECRKAKLSYCRNLLVVNRNGLIVDSRVWEATGIAERYAALEMLQEVPGIGRVTVGGDKGFDTADSASSIFSARTGPVRGN